MRRALLAVVAFSFLGLGACSSDSDNNATTDENGSGGGTSSGSGGSGSSSSKGSGGSSSSSSSKGSGGSSAASSSSGSGGSSSASSSSKGGSSGSGGSSSSSSSKGGSSGSGGSSSSSSSGSSGSGGSSSSSSSSSGSGGSSSSSDGGTCSGFQYGLNYAWKQFGGDFGGISAWSIQGVAGSKAAITADLTEMKNSGVDTIRWWMFPVLEGEGIKLDSSGTPTGLGDTTLDDVKAALDIAAQVGVHLKPTLFSFNNFCGDHTAYNVTVTSIKSIVTDDTKRAALISKVVTPIAAAVEASSNKDRLALWDVINEPEWIITGSDGYGDQAFDPQATCTYTADDGSTKTITQDNITFAQAETFVKDVVTALHAASSAPVTVGSAAVKWAKAWSKVGLDVYDFHWYAWVDQYFPNTKTPADYGVSDKAVYVGEFPLVPGSDTTGKSFGGLDYAGLVDNFYKEGYAGVAGWAFSDASGAAFSWSSGKASVKSWADAHGCGK